VSVTGDFQQNNIIEELYLIESNLNTLDQILQQQIDSLTTTDDLRILYNQHKVRICLI
jgi:hypothetical protein